MNRIIKISYLFFILIILCGLHLLKERKYNLYEYGVINTSPNRGMEICLYNSDGKFIGKKKTIIKGVHKEWDKTVQFDEKNYYIINTEFNKLTGKLIQINKNDLSIDNIKLPSVFSFFNISGKKIFCGELGLGISNISEINSINRTIFFKKKLCFDISPVVINRGSSYWIFKESKDSDVSIFSVDKNRIVEVCLIKGIDEVLSTRKSNDFIYILGVKRGYNIEQNIYKIIKMKNTDIVEEYVFELTDQRYHINDFYFHNEKFYFPLTQYILKENLVRSLYSYDEKNGLKEIKLKEPYNCYFINKDYLVTASDNFICEYSIDGKVLKKKIDISKNSDKEGKNYYVFKK